MEQKSTGSTGMKERLQEKAHDAKERWDEAKERAAEQARTAGVRMRNKGDALLREQKVRVADRLGHYGSAVHRTAHQFEEEQDPVIGYYTHRVADRLDDAAHYLREREWSGLREDAEGFARRHQELFLGGMFIAGLVVARFLKASQDGPSPSRSREPVSDAAAEYPIPDEPTASYEPTPSYQPTAPYGTAEASPSPNPGGTTTPQGSPSGTSNPSGI